LWRGVIDHRWQLAPKGGNRTGKHQARWLGQRAAGFQHRQGAMQVDAHAKVKVRLGSSAYHGGEMEDAAGVRINNLLEQGRVSDVSAYHRQTCVGREWRLWFNGIKHHQRSNRCCLAIGTHQCTVF
jgi:hypothetical protein